MTLQEWAHNPLMLGNDQINTGVLASLGGESEGGTCPLPMRSEAADLWHWQGALRTGSQRLALVVGSRQYLDPPYRYLESPSDPLKMVGHYPK